MRLLAPPIPQYYVENESDPRLVSILRHYQYEHRVFQQRERECYYSKRMLSAKEPLKYMSWICDGMTQATVALPIKVGGLNRAKVTRHHLIRASYRSHGWRDDVTDKVRAR